ncbi:hypothetical protein H6P81_018837 [Aristolochia fimbriata]|uniref:Uncharacterized protein n=1 Tax=Aristolochia fimbriata TaxID=158543 RepID=A0AAV7E6I4_ARIFI|nr:hypothetical protein H6P81_018837 [Aristolochia fimbriata]
MGARQAGGLKTLKCAVVYLKLKQGGKRRDFFKLSPFPKSEFRNTGTGAPLWILVSAFPGLADSGTDSFNPKHHMEETARNSRASRGCVVPEASLKVALGKGAPFPSVSMLLAINGNSIGDRRKKEMEASVMGICRLVLGPGALDNFQFCGEMGWSRWTSVVGQWVQIFGPRTVGVSPSLLIPEAADASMAFSQMSNYTCMEKTRYRKAREIGLGLVGA